MTPFIAEIVMFGGNFAPRSWALCDGQLLSINQNQALFSLLGTTYGGDGRTTFGLPDLRGRVAMHAGNGPGLSDRRLGAKGGSEAETLNTAQIPSHNHLMQGSTSAPATNAAAGSSLASGSRSVNMDNIYVTGNPTPAAMASPVTNTGGSLSHTNLQPYQVVNFIIALQGIFPSRN